MGIRAADMTALLTLRSFIARETFRGRVAKAGEAQAQADVPCPAPPPSRIKGIKAVTVHKAGRTYRYFYHRATGRQVTAEFGTAAFAAAVAALDAIARDSGRADATLADLVEAYRQSPEFAVLAPQVRPAYEKALDWLALSGGTRLNTIGASFSYRLRDKACRQRGSRFAGTVLQVTRVLLSWGKPRGLVTCKLATPAALSRKRAATSANDNVRGIALHAIF